VTRRADNENPCQTVSGLSCSDDSGQGIPKTGAGPLPYAPSLCRRPHTSTPMDAVSTPDIARVHFPLQPQEAAMSRHIHVLLPLTVKDARTILWHAAYCRWYDSREAGRHTRARMWGRAADLLCP